MAKKRLSHDQKRKAKLAKRARKGPAPVSLAYEGNKYKTEELVPVMHATETGIYQAYVMTKRAVTDHTVRAALEKLVLQMRAGELPPYEHSCEAHYAPGEEEDLVIWAIRHNWHHLFEELPHPGTANLIGVLRTLLGSVEVWSTPGPSSRGYLHYVEGFLKKTGVEVHAEDEDEDEDELLELGRDWCEDDDDEARADFLEMAEELIAGGEGEYVANTAQQLLGEYGTGPHVRELSLLSIRAQNAPRQLP
jgi:hypothetical protein